MPADATVAADAADLEVKGIVDLWGGIREGARGGVIVGGGGSLIESFVRA